jgi:hypothetical protein
VRTAPYTAIALAIGLMLGSCAQWQAEQELRQSQQAQAQAAATAANDDAQCQSYGAAPGSQSYLSVAVPAGGSCRRSGRSRCARWPALTHRRVAPSAPAGYA